MTAAAALYVGRFAPSPTGTLHLGSLIAAVASYLDAKAVGGRWLLRIEDLDPPREVAGSAEAIIASLLAHGLHWDGEILWQSERTARYEAALAQLAGRGQVFHCNCSRARLAELGGRYDGHCRRRPPGAMDACAIRLIADDVTIAFEDALQGPQRQRMNRDVGDFVIRRRDGIFAYQLAVVVDDADQGITHIVRGADLLQSTARQIYLQGLLQLPSPQYAHIPLLANKLGQKLSKQNLAPPLDDRHPGGNLRAALAFLGQPAPPSDITQPGELLSWATQCWQLTAVPRSPLIIEPAP